MTIRAFTAAAGLAALAAPAGALAQARFLINDRTNDAVWAIHDLNANNVIDEPDEVFLFFDGGNSAGAPGPGNPTCLAASPAGWVLMGDQGNRCVYLLRDHNRDGHAQGIAESVVAADAGNASGVSLASPSGAAFDPSGTAYITNAGTALGNDAVYRLKDLDLDGRFQSPGEITEYIGEPVFGPGNGPFSPQEIVFDAATLPVVGYLRDAASGTRGVYRFVDSDSSGRADDPGEFTTFFSAANASGIILGAGFSVTIDHARPHAVYMLQTVASPTRRQVLRLTDANSNQNAQDPGEAVVVWETTEAFAEVSVISLEDGGVLITDASADRVIRLTDLNNDGLFTDPSEQTSYFANANILIGDLRQMAPIPAACRANCDDSTAAPALNVSDFICFQTAFAAADPYANCDGSTIQPILNVSDFICFQAGFAAGCP